jgi:hypothetical protein
MCSIQKKQVSRAVLAACLFALPPAVWGQEFLFGVVAGASLTQDFQNKTVSGSPTLIAYSTPKRYIVGGMIEAELPLHFSIEANALYHELEYTNADIGPNGTRGSISPSPVVTWEFPVLAKYRFSLEPVKPFIEAGPSFRISGNLNGTSPSTHGFAIGGGIEAHIRKLRIAPEIRYLHWAPDTNVGPVAPFTVQNQVELLAGFAL